MPLVASCDRVRRPTRAKLCPDYSAATDGWDRLSPATEPAEDLGDRLRLEKHVDDLVRHAVHDQHLILHFYVPVVAQLGDVRPNWTRQSLGLDAFWKLFADRRREVLCSLGSLQAELDSVVLGQHRLSNLLALLVGEIQLWQRCAGWHVGVAAQFHRAAGICLCRRDRSASDDDPDRDNGNGNSHDLASLQDTSTSRENRMGYRFLA